MIYLVIIEKLTPEGRKDFKKVLDWQKRFDEWLMSHGATWKSVKHFVTEVASQRMKLGLDTQTTQR